MLVFDDKTINKHSIILVNVIIWLRILCKSILFVNRENWEDLSKIYLTMIDKKKYILMSLSCI